MRTWAIGLKGWVEIRLAKQPPKKITSQVMRNSYRWHYDYLDDRDIRIPAKIPLKVVSWEGGRTLHTISTKVWKKLMGKGMKMDHMVELSPSQIKDFRKGLEL